MMERTIDLHTHSTASDGIYSPSDNVRLARAAGLAGIAITDHDTVAGIAEALEEGARQKLVVVPGIEISSASGGQDIHVLGYYIDWEQKNFLERLAELRKTREHRNEMLIARLNELGMQISLYDLEQHLVLKQMEKGADESIGRPHFAEVMIAKGYVSSMQEAFAKYLGKDGLAYVNVERISPFTALDWIKEAGGTAVLAHPGLYHDDELAAELIAYGIDGIEVFHADHTPEDERRYLQMAEENGLIATAGSDFHGERNGVVFHSPLGSKKVSLDITQKLKSASKIAGCPDESCSKKELKHRLSVL